MLGDPDALIAPGLGVLGQGAGVVEGRPPIRTLPDAAKLKYR